MPRTATKPAGIGHNSITGEVADRLRSLVARIERLTEEKRALSADIKDIFVEAKSSGFDTKVLREVIRLRSRDPTEVEEMEVLLGVYRRALES